MEINAQLVKSLREKTGAGILDCKKALVATEGDIEKAVDWLRENGLAKAAKKGDRVAAEGLTSVKVQGNTAVILEVNSETDFVAKNEQFQALVSDLANLLLTNKPQNIDAAHEMIINDVTVHEFINSAAATIGEKLSLRRFEIVEKNDNQTFGDYIHLGGKISVLTLLEGQISVDEARLISMHIAAFNPQYIDESYVPGDVVDRERKVLTEQALNEGKPANVVEKMVEGRVRKYLQEICLLDQEHVTESDLTVRQSLEKTSSTVKQFTRFQVGEGIEKEEVDFAAEVMSQVRQ